MDLTLLEHTIKTECRTCFDDFKHCFINNPFGVYDKDILKATIQSEIVESLGKKTLKTFIHENMSKAQFEYVSNRVQKYKQLTKKLLIILVANISDAMKFWNSKSFIINAFRE